MIFFRTDHPAGGLQHPVKPREHIGEGPAGIAALLEILPDQLSFGRWRRHTHTNHHCSGKTVAHQVDPFPKDTAQNGEPYPCSCIVPEKLLEFWKEKSVKAINAEESRGHWDYLYSAKELIELTGNRFHKKKNLVNQFKKKYDYQYVPFDAKMIDMALAMQEDWCTWRDCESSEALSAENRAISRILDNRETIYGLTGGALLVGQEMVAYTIAEQLSQDTIVIHFEKGNPDYKGAYQAINRMFLEHNGEQFDFVNREQDLGDEGLRKAKLSYHPVDFVKKYRVTLK